MQNTLDQSSIEAAAALRRIVHGLRAAQALFVVAELRIADHLATGPLTGSELAVLTGTHAGALGRVMRTLCVLDVFAELGSGHFTLGSAGRLLRSDVDGSHRSVILLLVGAARWRCWSSLLETVRTGENACDRVLGMPLFDFYAAHEEESKIHDDAMRSMSATHAKSVVDAIDFPEAGMIVDVGGGTGELLAAALAANSGLSGILYDLPNVVSYAAPVLAATGVANRCKVEGGSFLEKVPGGGDVYLLKQVIHDWDDERATTILRCCRQCMPSTARLLIIERRMPESAEPGKSAEAFFLDLEMLVMNGGRERTETEYRRLLADTGFKLLSVSQTASPLCVFDAKPV
jgi:hypothetical protein